MDEELTIDELKEILDQKRWLIALLVTRLGGSAIYEKEELTILEMSGNILDVWCDEDDENIIHLEWNSG